MKVKIQKNNLLNGLHLVLNVVGSRTTLPILSNVLLRASESEIQLTTTDLDVAVRCAVPAEVAKSGTCSLPVKKIALLARELPDSEVLIEADAKNAVLIRSGSSFAKMVGLPAEEFPALPKLEKVKKVRLPQAQLKETLRRTTYAISTDEARFVLNGLLFSFKAGKLAVVATDGRRLALVEQEMEIGKENEGDVIIPTKAVVELVRLLGNSGDVEIQISENQVGFEFHQPTKGKKGDVEGEIPSNNGVLLITKQVAGNFPNYRQVIPTETKERVPIERETLQAAISRASLLTSDKASSVKLTFSKNQLVVSANSPDVGEAKETQPVKYSGKEIAIAFNPQFILDPLRALDTDEIFLELTDELSPGVIKVNGPFLYVVMPLRIS